jgi:uncharacterized damage-inducible protein DinB
MNCFPDPRVENRSVTTLSSSEVLQWNDSNASHWRQLFEQHPEALSLSCDIRGSSTVADLLQHIVAVELRYAERLANQPVTDYAGIPKSSASELFNVHTQAISKLQPLLANPAFNWEQEIELHTRSEANLIATRRAVLFHLLLHSMRHYAQLATLLRHHGILADWPMDFLMLSARRGGPTPP